MRNIGTALFDKFYQKMNNFTKISFYFKMKPILIFLPYICGVYYNISFNVNGQDITMVAVAQLVRAPDCGSGGRGFETHQPPNENVVL